MKRFYVTVGNAKKIPGMGRGPIRKPTLISENQYNMLKALGYDINIVEKNNKTENNYIKENKGVTKEYEPVKLETTSTKIENKDEVNEPVQEIQPEVIEQVDEPVELNEEHTVIPDNEENNEEDELILNDPDLSADAYYEDDFLTSKNMCKKILDKRGVQYENKASFEMLKTLVKESNPDVEFVSENDEAIEETNDIEE